MFEMPMYAHQWRSGLLMGDLAHRRSDDPRRELEAWADSAHGPMVSVPVATLRAAAGIRECSDRHVMTSDEDGPLRRPVTLVCRRPAGHQHTHSNGYGSWD